MLHPFSDLIEDITPDEIAASHILISYKGAERSSATRTKEEARKLAEEVLAKAQASGANFAALAGQYSDEPGAKERGGDLGTFKKGAMAKPFEDAAFKLKVGEISGVVETPFGFHIIKRTK
jgi:peptidyl-prolyl cis-trans isomerase D